MFSVALCKMFFTRQKELPLQPLRVNETQKILFEAITTSHKKRQKSNPPVLKLRYSNPIQSYNQL